MSKVKFVLTIDKTKYEDKINKDGADGSVIFYKGDNSDKSIYANGLRYDFTDVIPEQFKTTEAIGSVIEGETITAGTSVAELLKRLLYNDIYPSVSKIPGTYSIAIKNAPSITAACSDTTFIQGTDNYFPAGSNVTLTATVTTGYSASQSASKVIGMEYGYADDTEGLHHTTSKTLSGGAGTDDYSGDAEYTFKFGDNTAQTTSGESKGMTDTIVINTIVSSTAYTREAKLTGYARTITFPAVATKYYTSKAGNYDSSKNTYIAKLEVTTTIPSASTSITIYGCTPLLSNGIWRKTAPTKVDWDQGTTTTTNTKYCASSYSTVYVAFSSNEIGGDRKLYVPSGKNLSEAHSYNTNTGVCDAKDNVSLWIKLSSSDLTNYDLYIHSKDNKEGATTYKFTIK